MKKRMPGVLIFVFFFVMHSYAQNIFYDVSSLRRLKGDSTFFSLNDSTKKKVATILRNYLPDSVSKDTGVAQILNYYFKNNRFIGSMINPAFRRVEADQGNSGPLGQLIAKAGNLDVTSIADGLAKFLVERAKEELSLAFFEKFKADMEKPEFAELRILFPQTHATLQLIDKRIYQYAAYLTELREAFLIDLKDLGYNLPAVLDSQKYREYFSQHQELRTFIALSAQISQLVLRKDSKMQHAGQVIDSLNPDHYFSLAIQSHSDTVVNGGIKVLQLVSASFRSRDTTRYWVKPDSMAALLGDSTGLRLYLGLLYTKAGFIYLGNGTSLKTLMDNLATHYRSGVPAFAKSIVGFTEFIGEYDSYWNYKKKDTIIKDSSILHYYLLYTKAVIIISQGIQLVQAFDPAFHPGFEKYLNGIGDLGEVYIEARQNKYSLAILSMIKFFNDMQWKEKSKFVQKFSTYGAFIAEVAQAKTSDEVKDIIEKTVLPVGSASIKKNSRFNISLNAYLGGFFGNEYLPDNGIKHWANTAGITAPIGIAFSKPLIINNCSWGSISGFLSVIDIGAIASFRFKDSSSAQLPKLTLQNIFAPGLGLVWGIPKVPVSLGYMYQWGPALREITATDAKLNTGDLNRRWFFFLAVDIPLLNIYNKPR